MHATDMKMRRRVQLDIFREATENAVQASQDISRLWQLKKDAEVHAGSSQRHLGRMKHRSTESTRDLQLIQLPHRS